MTKCLKCSTEVQNAILCDKCQEDDMKLGNAIFGDTIKEDGINHPKHYNTGQYEAIDVIEDWELGFCLGNVVKYISRAGKKDENTELKDLKKALWYLERHVNNLEKK